MIDSCVKLPGRTSRWLRHTHVWELHPVVDERDVDGGTAAHEHHRVDELQLGAGDDGGDDLVTSVKRLFTSVIYVMS